VVLPLTEKGVQQFSSKNCYTRSYLNKLNEKIIHEFDLEDQEKAMKKQQQVNETKGIYFNNELIGKKPNKTIDANRTSVRESFRLNDVDEYDENVNVYEEKKIFSFKEGKPKSRLINAEALVNKITSHFDNDMLKTMCRKENTNQFKKYCLNKSSIFNKPAVSLMKKAKNYDGFESYNIPHISDNK